MTSEEVEQDRKTPFVAKPSMILWVSASGALLHALSAGLVIGFFAAGIDSMKARLTDINWTKDVESWVASTFAIGALVGALVAGPIVTKLGPRMSLIVNSGPYLIGWVLVIWGKSVPVLILGRLLGGLSIGFSTGSVPVYVLEVSTEGLRGSLGVSFQMLINFGICFAYILGYVLQYQAIAGISSIFAIAAPLIMFICPESPAYLNAKHGSAGRDLVIGALSRLRATGSQVELEYEAMTSQGPVAPQAMVLGRSDIVRSNVWKPLLCALGLSFFQQFTGNNAVIFYQVEIFKQSGFSLDPKICAIITGAVLFLSTFLGAILIGKFGRKTLLIVSAAGMAITLMVLGIYFTRLAALDEDEKTSMGKNLGWLPLVSLMAFLGVFSIGFGPIVWMMIPEITPYFARNFVTSIGTFFNWFLVFVITKAFPAAVDALGIQSAFYFFGVWAAVAIAFV